ncbi:MAG: hypothetical protein RIQ59_1291 [Bacteroidota bacterium]|jgi:predicted membrane protein
MAIKKTSSDLTVLTIVVGLLLLYVIYKLEYLLFASLFIGLLGVFSPNLSNKIHLYWMKISNLIGFIFPKLILTVLYYCVLVPISFVSRVIQKEEPLQLKNNRRTTFKNVYTNFDANFFQKIW